MDDSKEHSSPSEPDQPEFQIFYSNTLAQETDSGRVIYRVLQSMGYNLQLREGAVDGKNRPLPDYSRVMIDSDQTRYKINNIFNILRKTDVNRILSATSRGYVQNLENVLTGHPEKNTSWGWEESTKTLDLEDPRTKIALEKCFLLAYSLHAAIWKGKEETMFPEFKKRYDLIKEKGLEPIDPEQMGGMIVPVISEAIAQNPSLAPDA